MNKSRGDFTTFITNQLKYCKKNNYLHAKCAESLREKQLFLQKTAPKMTPILGDFILVSNSEPIFSLDNPSKAAYFYKTAREERKEARAKEWEKMDQEIEEMKIEWAQKFRDWIHFKKDFYKRKNELFGKRRKFQKALSSSDDEDDKYYKDEKIGTDESD